MQYDDKGRLTRAGMEAVINSGGSFTYKGRVISTAAGIPSPEDLASTPEEVAAAGDDIDAQIAALQARKAKLSVKPAPTPSSNPQDEPVFAKHPLSFYAGMSDEEIQEVDGVGQKTFEEIKAALADRK